MYRRHKVTLLLNGNRVDIVGCRRLPHSCGLGFAELLIAGASINAFLPLPGANTSSPTELSTLSLEARAIAILLTLIGSLQCPNHHIHKNREYLLVRIDNIVQQRIGQTKCLTITAYLNLSRIFTRRRNIYKRNSIVT